MLERGEYGRAHATFNQEMKEAASVSELTRIWRSLGWKHGKLQRVESHDVERKGNTSIVDLGCVFESERLTFRVVLDEGHRVTGMWVLPPKATP